MAEKECTTLSINHSDLRVAYFAWMFAVHRITILPRVACSSVHATSVAHTLAPPFTQAISHCFDQHFRLSIYDNKARPWTPASAKHTRASANALDKLVFKWIGQCWIEYDRLEWVSEWVEIECENILVMPLRVHVHDANSAANPDRNKGRWKEDADTTCCWALCVSYTVTFSVSGRSILQGNGNDVGYKSLLKYKLVFLRSNATRV